MEANLSNAVLRVGVWIAVLVAALIVSIVGGLYVAGFVMGPGPQRPAAGGVPPAQAGGAGQSPGAGTGGAATGSASPSSGQASGGTDAAVRPVPPARAQVDLRVIPGTTVEVGQAVTLFDASAIPPGDSAAGYEWQVSGPDPGQTESLYGSQVTFTPKKEGTYRVRLTVAFRQAGRLQSDEVSFSATPARPATASQPTAARRTAGPITIWNDGGRVFFILSSQELGISNRSLVSQLTVDFWFGANEQSRFGPGDYLTDTPLVLTPSNVDVYSVRLSGQLPGGRALSGTYTFR